MENAEKERLIMKNLEFLGDPMKNPDYEKVRKQCEIWEIDWWEALKFFFEHSFFRGRRDKVSNQYYSFTKQTLIERFEIPDKPIKSLVDYTEEYKESLEKAYGNLQSSRELFNNELILNFKREKSLGNGNSIKHEKFNEEVTSKNEIVKLLITKRKVEIKWDKKEYMKEISLNNDRDLMMVLDVLKFISEDKEKQNIYKYLKDKIVNSGVKSVYNELTEIREIGDKIAALIIRDIVLLNPDISKEIKKKEEYEYAFPVDTWVKQIAEKLQEVYKLNCSPDSKKKRIISSISVSPIR